MADGRKRLYSPTGRTPHKPKPKRGVGDKTGQSSARKQLSYQSVTSAEWSEAEDRSITQFVLLSVGDSWPSTKSTKLWEGASKFLLDTCKTARTSGACRIRVLRSLQQRFSTPEVAEQFFTEQNKENLDSTEQSEGEGQQASPSYIEPVSSMNNSDEESISIQPVDMLQPSFQQVSRMKPEDQIQFISELFAVYCSSQNVTAPKDFLQLAVKGMMQLQNAGRSNILYGLSKGLGTLRSDGSDSLFPCKTVVTGLFEHCVNFFSATYGEQIRCPKDYRMWLQSMYSLFGNKWLNLHSGPMWKVIRTEQGGPTSPSSSRKIEDARVNIPALSARTIERDIAASSFTIKAGIQEAVLDEAVKVLPNEDWWIKSDGCDIIDGLTESMRLEWGGDIDLGDGKLKQQYEKYLHRIQIVKGVVRNLSSLHQRSLIISDLHQIQESLMDDLSFIPTALKRANDKLSEKLSAGNRSTDKELFSQSWSVDELGRLNENGRKLCVEIDVLLALLDDPSTDFIHQNIARRLTQIQDNLLPFIRGVTRHQRHAATHVLVTMISPSQRNKKPYALPVSCIPYGSLSESKARTHLKSITTEMRKRKMKVAGFVSNGEYNVFRTKGFSRAVSILRLRSDARNKFSRMPVSKMEEMLRPKVLLDGSLVGALPAPCVGQKLLEEIDSWKRAGASVNDVLDRLRLNCVPSGYTPTPWSAERPQETHADKLRSTLAQLEYSNQVLQYETAGVPFCTFLYVPEIHPITCEEYHEREDDAHVLKRIATSTRHGGPKGLHLERFAEALEDSESLLTYPALTGQRKQSVRDAERLLSKEMAEFMKKKGYSFEAHYIETILNWRRSSDERGLTQLQRCRFNYQILNYLLDELMPWYKDTYDFSKLEVNRSLSGVRGMTRQTLIALTTTIESREWVRRRRALQSLPPEHPRAGSTDDVECFFSVLRNTIGTHFTSKSVMVEWRKICQEFSKRIDSNLPFFYYTSTHDRYYEGEREDFDTYTRPTSNPRQQRVRTREQPGNLAVGRATLIKSGAQSIRRQYHNLPVELPPPPTASIQTVIASEHSY